MLERQSSLTSFALSPRDKADSAEVHSMRRVGIIDVGSNSVRLVVFDGATRSPAYFFNEKVQCRLGANLNRTGKLSKAGRGRALRAIKRFAMLAEGMRVSSLTTVGTAAVREASDSLAFLEEVKAKTGIEIQVASGEEEARLAAQGVFLGWPGAKGIVCDFGGSSTEMVEVSDRRIGNCLTARLGHLSLARNDSVSRRREFIRDTVADIRRQLSGDYPTLFLVGGSWRVLALLDMERCHYPLKVLNEYRMSCEAALATVAWTRHMGGRRLRSESLVSSERLRSLPASGMLLEELVRQFRPSEIGVSAYGIREGLLYERMPEELRQRDPLIEACLHSEFSSARLPGFGDNLFKFVRPLFKRAPKERLRLVRAACLLHDVTWRAHPDYRAEISFDNATRANLGGVDHPGRVFIAVALFHRYRNAGHAPLTDHLRLLREEEAIQAEILGKAMRFGAMLTASVTESIGRLTFRSRRHVLTLVLPKSFEGMFGEVVETRFASLAKSMDCEARVEVV